MDNPSQGQRRCSVAVAGVAGSGKSTLGHAVAVAMRLPLLDLDAITNPLLDGLVAGGHVQVGPDAAAPGAGSADRPERWTAGSHSSRVDAHPAPPPGHWLAGPHGRGIREARYAAMRAVARDVAATAGGAVLVAPFTAELRGGSEWADLRDAVAPGELRLLWLSGDPALLAERRAARGEPRDAYRGPDEVVHPTVPHIAIEADLTADQQLFRALRALGHQTPIDPSDSIFDWRFDAVLCDLDGVLVDSTASVSRSWSRFAREFGVSAQALQENHGQPAATLVGRLLGPERLADGLGRIEAIEVADAHTVHPVPGAREFFAGIPAARRAVVTSGTPPIALARLRAAGFPPPHTLVTVADVERGKPDPAPYLLAARRLGVAPTRCLVVEDAPAGIAAALAAGCRVLAVHGTAPGSELAGAAMAVDGLDRVTIQPDGRHLRLTPRSVG